MNEIVVSNDGSHTIRSGKFGALYHSHHGSIQESNHVFIEAGLEQVSKKQASVHILEMGFGTGLNALLTYRFALYHKLKVSYTAYEAYPIGIEMARQLNYQSLLSTSDQVWRDFLNMHLGSDLLKLSPHFDFELVVSKMEELNIENKYDVVYYDAFAPSTQPELWDEKAMGSMFLAMKSGGVLTTYCAQGAVKRAMRSVGFVVEALPGPIGKREMTRAIKPISS